MKSHAMLMGAVLWVLASPTWALEKAEAEAACKSGKLQCPQGSNPQGSRQEGWLGCRSSRSRSTRVGPQVECSPNGRATLFGEWSDSGRKEGRWTNVYPDGSTLVTEYLNRRVEGRVVHSFPNGKPQMEAEYRAGRKNGQVRGYRMDGSLSFEEEWKAGRRVNEKRYEYSAKPPPDATASSKE